MKTAFLSVLCLCGGLFGQAPAPTPEQPLDDSTLLAVLGDGHKVTYGEIKMVLGSLPPQQQQLALRNRKALVQQYALMRKLAMMGEEAKLYDQSPTKEMLAMQRMQLMMSAEINDAMSRITISPQELQKAYDANQSRYRQVQVKAIYVSFNPSPQAAPGGKKSATEPEAKAKIEKVLKEIRGGADFVKLVKEYSEDQTSAAKEGDFGNIRRGDNLPDAVRNAIFALKPGEVSEPVRQPNGFYVFKAISNSTQPFEQVRDQIFNDMKQVRFREWMEKTQRGLNVSFVDAEFFKQPPAAQVPAPPAPSKPPAK